MMPTPGDQPAAMPSWAVPDDRPVAVFGSCGGTGTSVVSALLADYRSQSSDPESTWWVDLSGTDSDIVARMRTQLDQSGTGRNSLGTNCWRPTGLRLADVVEAVRQRNGVPVIDAGNHALSWARELADTPRVVPVVVIAPRPDLLNRARTVLSAWRDAGIVGRAIVVISCQVPALNHAALTEMVTDAVVDRVAGVIGLNYDPVLGAGAALDHHGQEALTNDTVDFLDELAAMTAEAPAEQHTAGW